MVTQNTKAEIEEYLGQVPSFIEALPEASADHAWAQMRDLELAETELPSREKALIALGAAAAIQCPYCIHFHRKETEMEGVSEDGLQEAIAVASTVRYFSTVLHGAEVGMEDFTSETAAIMAHVEKQQAAADDD